MKREAALLVQIEFDLPEDARSVSLCRRALRSMLEALEIEDEKAEDIALAVSEAVTSVVRHGGFSPGHRYGVRMQLYPEVIRVTLQYQAHGADCAAALADEEQWMGRLGLQLIQQLAERATVQSGTAGSCTLEAEFRLPRPYLLEPEAAPP